jgi:DNA replication licensing factor MCM5
MTLSPIATEEHVEEALRLFNVSTVDAINSGHVLNSHLSNITIIVKF